MGPCWVSVGNHKIGYVSNDDRARSDNGVTPNSDAVRDAGSHSNRRTLTDSHKSPHKNTGSDARKIVKCAVMVHRAGCIDDSELSDPGTRPYVRASKNSSTLAYSGGRRDYGRGMLDDR